jgi:HlyD family secretion protein
MSTARKVLPLRPSPEIAVLPVPAFEDARGHHPTRRRLLLAAVAVAAAVAAAGVGVDLARRPDAPGAPVFVTEPVSRGPLHGVLPLEGQIEPAATAAVYAPAAGRVAALLVAPGARVTRGQTVARLHPGPARAALARAEADAVAAEAAAYAAEVDHEQLIRKLGVEGRRDIPPDVSGDLADLLGLSQARLATSEAELSARDAGLREARRILGEAEVRAPADGVVLETLGEVGAAVAPGARLYLLDLAPARRTVAAPMPAASLSQVAVGQPASFVVTWEPGVPLAPRGRRFSARLEALRPGVPPSSADQKVRATFTVAEAEASDLRPGARVRLEVALGAGAYALTVPPAALRFLPPQLDGNRPAAGPAVWVLEPGRQLHRVPVEVGASDGQRTEVRGEGLREGVAVAVGLARTR